MMCESAEWQCPMLLQRSCMKGSKCSKSDECRVYLRWRTCIGPSSSTSNFSQWVHLMLHCCLITCQLHSVKNKHSCCNVVSLSFRTMQHLITIVLSRLYYRTGSGKSLNILHTLCILFLELYFCFLGMRSRQRFGTADTINMAILESLCHLSGDYHGAANDSCHDNGTSAKNMEGIMLSTGYVELYSFVQFTPIKKKCGIY